MTAYNVVRFRVKPGSEKAFEEAHRALNSAKMKGFRKGALVNTGEGSYCFVGEWGAMSDIVAARPEMIAFLDTVRGLLEDLGGGLGVTDPVSGEAVVEVT